MGMGTAIFAGVKLKKSRLPLKSFVDIRRGRPVFFWTAIDRHLYNPTARIPIPFGEYVIGNFVSGTETLHRFAMRQRLCLVLEIKSFQIFATVHIFVFLTAADVGDLIVSL